MRYARGMTARWALEVSTALKHVCEQTYLPDAQVYLEDVEGYLGLGFGLLVS
jgi:hypothetical protein